MKQKWLISLIGSVAFNAPVLASIYFHSSDPLGYSALLTLWGWGCLRGFIELVEKNQRSQKHRRVWQVDKAGVC